MIRSSTGLSLPGWRRVILAITGGLAIAQLSWALGYWNVSTVVGSAMLLLVFALFGSVSRSHLLGGVSREQVALRAGIAAPAFGPGLFSGMRRICLDLALTKSST